MLSIIIPTYNRTEVLRESLKHLSAAIEDIESEVIIVNDYKEQKLSIGLNIKNMKVVQNPKSGAATARNYGFQMSRGNILLFLDDDMIVSKDVLNTLLELVKTNKKIFIPNWMYPDSLNRRLKKNKFGRFLIEIKYNSLEGWINTIESWDHEKVENQGIASYCLMMTRENFQKIKGYNENFSFAGFEDYDLSFRLRQAGFQFYILTNLRIYHNEFDRINLISWLRRKRRNAQTQREAYELGYTNLKIDNLLFSLPYPGVLIPVSTILEFISKLIPNSKLFDLMFFRLVKVLIAINMCLGYNYDYRENKN